MILLRDILRLLIKIFFKVYFLIFPQLKLNKSSKKVLELYDSKDFSSLFTMIRLWDAPFDEVDKAVNSKGKIIDLGCGDGILANYLAVSSSKREITGIEINKDRLANANKGLKNTRFRFGSILNFKFSKSDVYILSHVLHHLPSLKTQEKVIGNCYKNLKKGGKLVIVEIAEKPFFKYLFTWITDAVIVPILFEKKFFTTDFYYRLTGQWVNLLEKTGFEVTHKLIHKRKPFSHVLFVGIKK